VARPILQGVTLFGPSWGGPPNAFENALGDSEQRLLACEFCNERVCRKPDFSLWHKGFTASIEVTY
jgi:hypothetical protein